MKYIRNSNHSLWSSESKSSIRVIFYDLFLLFCFFFPFRSIHSFIQSKHWRREDGWTLIVCQVWIAHIHNIWCPMKNLLLYFPTEYTHGSCLQTVVVTKYTNKHFHSYTWISIHTHPVEQSFQFSLYVFWSVRKLRKW